MEKLPPGKCTSSALEVQARSATVILYDCLELILERLALVDHYRGWDSLSKLYSLRASPFSRHWLLINSKMVCESWASGACVAGGFDSPDLPVKHHYNCFVLFSDPGQSKEQEICVNLEGLTETPGSHPVHSYPRLVTDKGLLFLNLHQDVRSINRNRHDRFLVLNPINNSKSFLPPIPSPLCTCELYNCGCQTIPLKLTVNMEQKGGLGNSLSSSYKAYILERKDLPKPLRRNSKVDSYNFRITVYDSMAKLWISTGVEWVSTSRDTQIFPMRDGKFYVATGSSTSYCESLHRFLYKFQDGVVLGKVKAPAKYKYSCKRRNIWHIDTIGIVALDQK